MKATKVIGRTFNALPKFILPIFFLWLAFFAVDFAQAFLDLPTDPEAGAPLGKILGGFAAHLSFFLLILFGQGAVFGMTQELFKVQEIEPSSFFRYGKRNLWPLTKLALFLTVVVIMISLPLGLILGVGATLLGLGPDPTPMATAACAFLALGFFALLSYITVLISFSSNALIASRIDVISAIKASINFVLGRWWQVFGFLLLLSITVYGLMFLIAMLFGFIMIALEAAQIVPEALTNPYLMALLQSLTKALYTILFCFANMTYYLGNR